MIDGSAEEYFSLLSVFHNDGLEKIKEIENSLEAGNISSYTIYVHALKSSLLIIGSKELSQEALKLEKAGNKMDMAYINANNPVFIDALKALLNNIQKFLTERKAEQQTGSIDIESLTEKLNDLKSALETINIAETKKIVTELREITQHNKTNANETIEEILKNVMYGDYNTATKLIDSIINNSDSARENAL